MSPPSRTGPQLQVLRGDATPEEIAALLAVVAARSSARAALLAPSGWADRSPGLRTPVHPGPGAWRASGLPR